MPKAEHERLTAEADAPPPHSKRRSRVVLGIIAVCVILLTAIVVQRIRSSAEARNKKPPQGPVPVRVYTIEHAPMPITLEALGTVTPLATVTVKSQIAGRLMEISFREGQDVKKGEQLALIDPRPYQAALEQAKGTLARDEALLANAELDLSRYEKLIEQDSGTRQQRDTQRATVRQAQATLQTDKAMMQTAELNLMYCHIIAPVAGRVGLRKVDLGNYITVGDPNGIVVITQLHPISVIFPVPEDALPQVAKRFKSGAVLAVTAFDRSGSTQIASGQLATIDNTVDAATGTVRMRAMFTNEDETLYPQQFVNVKVLVDTIPDALVMPTAGVQRGSEGSFVYVVGDDNVVKTRLVTLGPANEGLIAVTKGIEAGDRVVIDGTDRLRDGAKVNVAATGERTHTPPSVDDTETPRDASADATPQKRMHARDGAAPDGGPREATTDGGR